MTKLKITVTKEVLEKTCGCRQGDNIGKHCAIAHAIRDIFPKAFTESEEVYPFGLDKALDYSPIKLPTKAKNFIQEFDSATKKDRLKMKPICFEVNIPDDVIDQINIDEIKPLLENHPTLQLV